MTLLSSLSCKSYWPAYTWNTNRIICLRDAGKRAGGMHCMRPCAAYCLQPQMSRYDAHVCPSAAGAPANRPVNGGTCNGDSGGPAFTFNAQAQKAVQYGIVSFGQTNNCGGWPSGMANVAALRYWIDDAVSLLTGTQWTAYREWGWQLAGRCRTGRAAQPLSQLQPTAAAGRCHFARGAAAGGADHSPNWHSPWPAAATCSAASSRVFGLQRQAGCRPPLIAGSRH